MEENRKSPLFSLPEAVLSAITQLNNAGYEAYAVGGAVRDLLRGVTPNDYDITTSATPDEMKRVFSAHRTVETGIAHGTLTVLFDKTPLEITTFRVDGSYTDSRHPDSVRFTRSLREDAARRDFTINAMAYHPSLGVFDFFGGEADIASRRLRTVGDATKRFTEDALRILRGLRFAAVLNYTIEEDTARSMCALKDRLTLVAAERIREELIKLLCAKKPSAVMREYREVFAVFLPEIKPLFDLDQQNPHHDFDLWEHTLRVIDAAPRRISLRLAALCHDLGKPVCFTRDENGVGHFYGHAKHSAKIAEALLSRLRFDNKTKDAVVRLVAQHDTVPAPKTRQFARMRSRFGDAFLTDWLSLVRADRTGQKQSLSPEAEAVLCEAEGTAALLLENEPRQSLATLSLRGDDLIALGYRGRAIGDALSLALEAVLDGRVKNEKEALLMFLKNAEPTPPIECERKFLIRMPSEKTLLAMGATQSHITQTYLTASPTVTARVRQRVFAEKTVYTHTEKRTLTALSAIEEEREITAAEYTALLRSADLTRHSVEKTRYALPYEGHVLEIDVYPFWTRQAVLEIELESEKEAFALPEFLTVLREVTEDKRYKNASLAKNIPAEESSLDDKNS